MRIKGGGEGVEKINKVQPALPHLFTYMVSSRPPAGHPLKRAAGTGSEVVPGEEEAAGCGVQPNTIDVLTPGGQVMPGIPYLHFYHCRECSLFPAAGSKQG